MELLRHDDPATVELLADFFRNGTLVPVFGAGFTVGERAQSGASVPSGTKFAEIMLQQLKESGEGLSEKELKDLEGYKFSDLCEVYFDQNILSQELTKKTIRHYFYNVSLASDKAALINDIDWKYIYTLNIDNAIEQHSKYRPIYPYDENLNSASRGYRPVYKLHGDVFYEVTHSADRLVFRKASYLESISTNRRMLELLGEDLANKNIVFIGCSLTDEDDIAFMVSGQQLQRDAMTRRVIFKSEAPGRLEESVLRRHGVNTVILIESGKYSQIYALLQEAYAKSAEGDVELERYSYKVVSLSDDAEANTEFLIKGVVEAGLNNSTTASVLPFYYGSRTKEQQVLAAISANGTLVVSGPRVSGRTLLLRAVANAVKDRKVLFVESGVELETHFANKLLGLNNALIIFDSKTVDADLARVIKASEARLKSQKTSLIVALDAAESHIVDLLSTSKLNIVPVIELSRVFDGAEIGRANSGLKRVRCPAFARGKKLLDNLFHAYEALGQNAVVKRVPKEKELLKLLYILSVRKKVDGDWASSISASLGAVESLVNACQPYLEFEKVSISELASHSGYRVVCNSEAWLLAVIAELNKSRGEAWCVDAVYGLVRDLPADEVKLSIELTLFDNLNFAFGGDSGGAGDFILSFYERLQSLRGSHAEFYVQKAKAYYSMYRRADTTDKLSECLDELAIADTWARSEDDVAAERNIRHTSALVSLRRAAESSFANIDYTIDAVRRTWKAISSEHSNSGYVAKLADGGLRGSEFLQGLIHAVKTGRVIDPKLLGVKDQLDSIQLRVSSMSGGEAGKRKGG